MDPEPDPTTPASPDPVEEAAVVAEDVTLPATDHEEGSGRTKIFERWQPAGRTPRTDNHDEIDRRRRETQERKNAVRSMLGDRAAQRRRAIRGDTDVGIADAAQTRARPLRRGRTVARAVREERVRLARALERQTQTDSPSDGDSVFKRMLNNDTIPPAPQNKPTVPQERVCQDTPTLGARRESRPAPIPLPPQGVQNSVWVQPGAFDSASSEGLQATESMPRSEPAATTAENASLESTPEERSAEAPTIVSSRPDSETHAETLPPAQSEAEASPPVDLGEALRNRTLREPVPLDALPMIGAGMRLRLDQLGIHSVQDLAAADAGALKTALGQISLLANVEGWIEAATFFMNGAQRKAV